MPTEPELDPEVRAEVGPLIADLRTSGWRVLGSRYDALSFGNWFVDLERDGCVIRLVKDRSQFMIDGPTKELGAAGLRKAFDRLSAFREAVVAWAAPPRAQPPDAMDSRRSPAAWIIRWTRAIDRFRWTDGRRSRERRT